MCALRSLLSAVLFILSFYFYLFNKYGKQKPNRNEEKTNNAVLFFFIAHHRRFLLVCCFLVLLCVIKIKI